MPRGSESRMLEILGAIGDDAPPLEEKLQMLETWRRLSEDPADLDRYLIGRAEEASRLRGTIHEIRQHQAKLREAIETLTSEPYYPAIFIGTQETPGGVCAVVQQGPTLSVVRLMDGLSLDELSVGDEVLLSHERNAIVSISSDGRARCGEIAIFERRIGEEYAILTQRGDEQIVVHLAASLVDAPLEPGDWVLWDRNAYIAFEKVERPPMRLEFAEVSPDLTPACVGGQDENLDLLLSAFLAAFIDPKKAVLYNQRGGNRILLWGPPGCGKTLMARVSCAELARRTGRRCRFAVVKPSEWEDPYVGVTQRNIRGIFRALKEATSDGAFAVLFLDEVESVGRIRGQATNIHGDKFLAALLAEIDGFEKTERVALLTASNRKDLIDAALLERISGIEIYVHRPRLADARAIFSIHLPPTTPMHRNGTDAAAVREEIIELAVSRLYAPNAENEICRIHFRDGKSRTVAARELSSGRVIEQICQSACRTAFLRELRGGEAGVTPEDMRTAVDDAIARLRTTLTIHNVRSYLDDLPPRIDVVAVEPIARRARRPHAAA